MIKSVIIAIIAISITGIILISIPIDEPKPASSISKYLDTQCTTSISSVNATTLRNDAKLNNAFAVNYYKDTSRDQNIFFSPPSIYMTFSMIYEGAREDTARQMRQIFNFEPDMDTRHNAIAHMISSINRDDPHTTLALSNDLWYADTFTPFETYLDIMHSVYLPNTKMVSLDNRHGYSDTWAYYDIYIRINNALGSAHLSDYTEMTIIGNMFFKGTWLKEFPKENTRRDNFHTSSGYNTSVDFMRIKDKFDYTHSNGAQILKMPYKGNRLSMLIILPDDFNGIKSLEDVISAKQIDQWINDLRRQEIIVSMPRFEMGSRDYPTYGFGISDKYGANLDGISDSGSSRSEIINVHDKYGHNTEGISDIGNLYTRVHSSTASVAVNAKIYYDEFAVTSDTLAIDSNPSTPHFQMNHPFIFTIYDDNSCAILFMGKIVDPIVREMLTDDDPR